MPQNTKNRYAITISPPPDKATFIDQIEAKHLKRNGASYAYVIEKGSHGTHPHIHIFIDLKVAKRKYDYRQSLITMCHRLQPDLEDKYDDILIHPERGLKYANNPLLWIQDYCSKEQTPVTFNIDMQKLQNDLKEKEAITERQKNKVIFQSRFIAMYEYHRSNGFKPGVPDGYKYGSSKYYLEYVDYLKDLGYEVSPMILRPRLYRRMMMYVDKSYGLITALENEFQKEYPMN